MWKGLRDTGTRRLWIAAGLSVAVHAAIAVSVQRHPGSGASPLTSEHTALPLFARLTTALGDSVLPTTAPVTTAPAETTIQSAPAPHIVSAAQVDPVPTEAGFAYYFKSSELDRRPFPVNRIEVPVPESATNLSGAVILRLRISETGRIDDAKIVMGTGIADFETAALREFLNARFHPGFRGNLPVRSEMTIEVTLSPPKNTARPQTAGAGNTQN